MTIDLKARWPSAVIAFRGYNTTNLGRSAELLEHSDYGPVVREHLVEASELCSQAVGQKIDLVQRVLAAAETRVEEFAQDVALIVSMELAQIHLLERFHGIRYGAARMAFGYSLGEITALICGGVCRVQDVLPPLLILAGDCAALAHDVTMGIVFSRDAELNLASIERLCQRVNQQGQGVMGVSARLSPNTVLVLGQGDTIDRFAADMRDVLGKQVHLRRHHYHWPPLHTPILWERHVPNRAAFMMHKLPITEGPRPPVFSLTTGKIDYDDHNTRTVLNRWCDHPQLLWEAVFETLSMGTNLMVHVGPSPNLVPATFHRIADNVRAQMTGSSPRSLGLRAVSSMWRPWLAKWVSSRSALLRAPQVEHVILEDWLLASAPSRRETVAGTLRVP